MASINLRSRKQLITNLLTLFLFLLAVVLKLLSTCVVATARRMNIDLRKLIKYEERMGINTQQNDYFESLFKRTTASYRAKIDNEISTRSQTKRKSNDDEIPTTSKQAASLRAQRVLQERNQGVGDQNASYSHDVSYNCLGSNSDQQSRRSESNGGKKTKQKQCSLIDSVSIKVIIEETLTQILQEKFSQPAFNALKATSTSKSLVEETVNHIQQKRQSDLQKCSGINTTDPATLKSFIEVVVVQVLQEKLSDLAKSSEVVAKDIVDHLNRDLQQKLCLSKERPGGSPSEKLGLQNINKPLDSQALVNQLLGYEDANNNTKFKKDYKSKSNKENSSTSNGTCIKRLRRSPKKKPEWQDPGRLDGCIENTRFVSNQRILHARNPTGSLAVRSGRSRCSSSVMIPRLASQGRTHKPKSDPVALYQYYKSEWENFRDQIPGETTHNRLRWHVRQRMLDPE